MKSVKQKYGKNQKWEYQQEGEGERVRCGQAGLSVSLRVSLGSVKGCSLCT